MASTNAFREVNPEKGLNSGLKLEEPVKDENKNCSLDTDAETSLDQGVKNLRLESAEKGIDSGKLSSNPGESWNDLGFLAIFIQAILNNIEWNSVSFRLLHSRPDFSRSGLTFSSGSEFGEF